MRASTAAGKRSRKAGERIARTPRVSSRTTALDSKRPSKVRTTVARQTPTAGTVLPRVLTSDQFVAGIIAALALKGRRRFVLTETELDSKFESAFEELAASENELGVRPNFTFYVDPYHGDSVSLRETLLAAKEKELIALNNPTFRTFDVKLTEDRARRYLEKVPLPQWFLEQVVERHFAL